MCDSDFPYDLDTLLPLPPIPATALDFSALSRSLCYVVNQWQF